MSEELGQNLGFAGAVAPVDEVDGDTGAPEALELRRDDGVAFGPVGLQGGEPGEGFSDRLGIEHKFLIILAVGAPVGGEIDKDRFPFLDERGHAFGRPWLPLFDAVGLFRGGIGELKAGGDDQ